MNAGSVLITGGAGFIGSHLAERLLDDGCSVTVLDDFNDYYDPALKRENVARVAQRDGYALVEGDIRDRDALERAFAVRSVDAVVHLAARAGVRPSIVDPMLYASVNLDGTMQVLEACRRHGEPTLVFGSSSSVYGNNRKVPFSEADPVDHPISPYAATKKAGELLCHTYHHLFGLRVACLRFFTVFGPRQRPEMAIHKFATRLAAGEPIEQYGDGSSARDYTFIDDIVSGIVAAIDRCRAFHIWNLGGSRTTTLSDLVQKIASRLAVVPRIEQLPMQPGDVDRTWADVSRVRRELDWSPRVDIDEGLDRFVSWFSARRAGAPERES